MNWGVLLKPVLMHDPIGLLSMWGSTLVENQCLPHSNSSKATVDNLIAPSGFPEPCCGGAICSCPCGVLLIFVTEEVPIILWSGSYFAFLCKISRANMSTKKANHEALQGSESREGFTLNIPGLKLIKINITNHIQVYLLIGHLLPQIVVQKLLFCRMESEPWRDLRLTIHW